MKIKYTFADGTVSEVEVSEEIGNVILDSRRKEENLERKERAHRYSIDAIEYGDCDKFAPLDTYTPQDALIDLEEKNEFYKAFYKLTKIQQQRLQMLADGYSIHEIAETEGTNYKTVYESIRAAQKKFMKLYKTTPSNELPNLRSNEGS